MKNEAEFKREFKQSVKAYGGHSISLAAPMLPGIPDLWVAVPGYLPVLLEAKWLGEINRDKFSRKVPFTDMQKSWIKHCNEAARYSALGLIGFKHHGEYRCAIVDQFNVLYEQFSHLYVHGTAWVSLDKSTKSFHIPSLFSQVPIPKLTFVKVHATHTDTLLAVPG